MCLCVRLLIDIFFHPLRKESIEDQCLYSILTPHHLISHLYLYPSFNDHWQVRVAVDLVAGTHMLNRDWDLAAHLYLSVADEMRESGLEAKQVHLLWW
jgi:hypothetical protein